MTNHDIGAQSVSNPIDIAALMTVTVTVPETAHAGTHI